MSKQTASGLQFASLDQTSRYPLLSHTNADSTVCRSEFPGINTSSLDVSYWDFGQLGLAKAVKPPIVRCPHLPVQRKYLDDGYTLEGCTGVSLQLLDGALE